MITLYGGYTTNTHKVSIALEELSIPYQEVHVSLRHKDQFEPWFLDKSPNNKFPLLLDEATGVSVWESGAILIYLCETYDNSEILLQESGQRRYSALQGAMFQAANIGPTLGRLNDQLTAPVEKKNDGMLQVFYEDAVRLTVVLDRMLSDGRPFLAETYSIADVMHFPWLKIAMERQFPQLIEKPRITDWIERIARRPAVTRGMTAFGQYN